MPFTNQRSTTRPFLNPRFIIAGIIACVSVIGYCSRSSINDLTGRKQHISMTPEDEIAIGVDSAPTMAAQFGGVSSDAKAAAMVSQVGESIVKMLPKEAIDYQYDFHLLADTHTVNAFALPGGQIFITAGLFKQLERYFAATAFFCANGNTQALKLIQGGDVAVETENPQGFSRDIGQRFNMTAFTNGGVAAGITKTTLDQGHPGWQ